MAYDLSVIDRYTLQYRRVGTTIIVDVVDTLANNVVESTTFINAVPGAPIPNEITSFGRGRITALMADVSLGGGGTFQALTDAVSIVTAVSSSSNFKVTLGGNRTLANPTGMSEGISYFWRIQQDVTGSRTLAFGTMFKFAGGVAPTLTTAANAVDIIVGRYDGTILLCASALNVA